MTRETYFDDNTPDTDGVCRNCGSNKLATLEQGIALARVPFRLDEDGMLRPDFNDPSYAGWEGPEDMETVGECCYRCGIEHFYADEPIDPQIVITAQEWRRRHPTTTATKASHQPTTRSTWTPILVRNT